MFENAYREIGRALSVRGVEDDEADVKALVRSALSREDAGSWLLIIDNADDVDLLFGSAKLTSYLPFSRKGSILFTTRNQTAAVRLHSREKVIRLEEMNGSEASQLLHQGLEETQIGDTRSTTELLHSLCHLPLAIRQASAFMASNPNVSVSAYLGLCRSSDTTMVQLLSENFSDQDRYEASRNPVATTWLISFSQLLRDIPLAAQYLGFICYLAERDIPLSLLPMGQDKVETAKAIGGLRAYEFISQRGTLDRFDIHRLVRLVMRNWLKEQGKEEEQITKTIRVVSEAFPWPEHENRGMWSVYLPHAEAALGVRDRCIDERALYYLLANVGQSNSLLGKYEEAEETHRETLELMEKVLGKEHPATLTSMNNIAEALRQQGKYDEAEQMHRHTLELREKVMGKEHPDTLTSMNNIAEALQQQGKYDEAEQMHRQTLGLREKVLGKKHP